MSAILNALWKTQEKQEAPSSLPGKSLASKGPATTFRSTRPLLPPLSLPGKPLEGRVHLGDLGFRVQPFNDIPDPRFFYANPVHDAAYATLLYGIQERKGFITLIGEAGTGKTTLLHMIEGLEKPIRTALFNKTTLTFDELLDCLCFDFDLPVKEGRRLEKIRALNAFLVTQFEEGGTGVLIIDEAHNLAVEVLENLRLLSNLEKANQKLFQIVLAGQPELEQKLGLRELRHLKQRIAVRCWLDRLKAQDVEPYISHRLWVAGCERPDVFTPEAVRRVALYSQGIPRLINTICDNALHLACQTAQQTISAALVEEVARDLRFKEVGRNDLRGMTLALQAIVRRGPKQLMWAGAGGLLVALFLAGGGIFPQQPKAPPAARSVMTARAPTTQQGDESGRSDSAPPTALSASLFPAELPVNEVRERASEPVARPQTPNLQERDGAGERDSAPSTVPSASLPPAGQPTEGTGEGAASVPVAQTPDLREEGQLITITRGDMISAIVLKMYGTYSTLAFDLIKEFNPHVADLDWIGVGESLWLPAPTRKALLREQPDGSYHLIVASSPTAENARQLSQRLRRSGYTTVTTPRRVSGSLVLYRIEIVGLSDREAVERAWALVSKLDTTG
jgi:general secretion pathway protein A